VCFVSSLDRGAGYGATGLRGYGATGLRGYAFSAVDTGRAILTAQAAGAESARRAANQASATVEAGDDLALGSPRQASATPALILSNAGNEFNPIFGRLRMLGGRVVHGLEDEAGELRGS
jgi:hypothetical protein